MDRIIITGANGSGKSHLAAQLHLARSDVPLVSFDAIKLTTNWAQRPRAEIDARLRRHITGPKWILEGGPSMLQIALPLADTVVWLDPPIAIRTWRLLVRPLKSRGQNRPELPDGNPDHLGHQYRFAWKSLRKDSQFRQAVHDAVKGVDVPVMRCHSRVDTDSVLALWTKGDASPQQKRGPEGPR